VLELSMQLSVYHQYFLRTAWGQFDFWIVVAGIISEWVPKVIAMNSIPAFRMVRLIRVARGIRVIPHARVLWMLVRGLASAMVTLGWSFVILALVIYAFGILGVELVHANIDTWKAIPVSQDARPCLAPDGRSCTEVIIEDHFGNLPLTLLTLLQITTLDSWSAIVRPLVEVKPWLVVYFLAFIGIACLAVMNLVTAVIVETSAEVAIREREVDENVEIQRLRETMEHIDSLVSMTEHNPTCDITKLGLVTAYTEDEEVRKLVDKFYGMQHLLDMFEVFDDDGSGSLTQEELSDGVAGWHRSPAKCILEHLIRHFHCFERELWANLWRVVPVQKAHSESSWSDVSDTQWKQEATAIAKKLAAQQTALRQEAAMLRHCSTRHRQLHATPAGPVLRFGADAFF